MRQGIQTRPRIAIALISAVLSGCAVGPRYERPQFPTPDSYKEARLGTEVLQPALPNDAASRREWWQTFGNGPLSNLEEQLVAGNPSLTEADARFRQAKAVVRQDRAAYAPTIGTSLSADRLHGSSGALNGIEAGTGQYSLTGDVSWEPDFWGRVRQTVAAGVASAQAARGDLENARLSLTATLALDYFQLRSFDADLVLLNESIDAYERSLTLTQNQYNAGLVARTDVAQAETQLASARAQAVDVTLQRAQMEHAVAVLVGVAPSALSLQPAPLEGEPLPVPLELPSRLLERRADVAAAERGWRRQRSDWRRSIGFLPYRLVDGIGRVSSQRSRAVARVAQPVLVGGSDAGADAVRWRRAAGSPRQRASCLRRRSCDVPTSDPDRLSGR